VLGVQAISQSYQISSVSFQITGKTRERALEAVLAIDTARVFEDKASLDAYIASETQLLLNQRVLEDAAIEVQELPSAEGEPIAVHLVVRTKDTRSIIALPKPQYDPNNGLLLSIRGRDYNFLGSMLPLKLDLNYKTNSALKHPSWETELQFDLPVRMAGRDLEWSFDGDLSYTQDRVAPLAGSSSVGLDLILPFGPSTLRIGPSQSLYFNPDNSDGSVYQGWFLESKAQASYSLALADLGDFGKLYGNADANIRQYWNPTGLDLLSEREGPSLHFSQGLSFSRVDWIGNFRRGLAASASIAEGYNIASEGLSTNVKASTQGYLPFGPSFGGSGRLGLSWYVGGADTTAGSPLRGILDSRINTSTMIYANFDFPVSVLHFMPQLWFNQEWMKLFSFEQHWSPFIDAGLSRTKETGAISELFDGWLSGGLELITYPLAFRSFYVRISMGWDLPALFASKKLFGDAADGKQAYEPFIGIGQHY
jgi:hypothetical protein